MGWQKRDFVKKAFAKIGLAGYVFDLTPEQLEDALSDLDAMMAAWNGKGIRVGYPLPSGPGDSDLDQETNVPDAVAMAIYLNLGIVIAPDYGKAVTPELRGSAKAAYDILMLQAALPMQRQFPRTMPAGAGNKPWRVYDDPFLRGPCDPLLAGDDAPIILE